MGKIEEVGGYKMVENEEGNRRRSARNNRLRNRGIEGKID